jgi:signal transduction histidine kinase
MATETVNTLTSVVSSHRVRQFANTLLKDIMCKVDARSGLFYFFVEDSKELVVNNFQSADRLRAQKIRNDFTKGIRRLAMRSSRRVGASFMSFPLIVNGKPLGIINVSDKSSGEAFTEADFAFACALCRYSSRILKNIVEREMIDQQKSFLAYEKSVLASVSEHGKLASIIAHQINSPLDGILRFVNLLFKHISPGSAEEGYLFEIKKNLLNMSYVVRSILSHSR